MNRIARIALTAAAVSLGVLLAGCDTFDPTAIFDADIFNTKKKLQGERKPVFPDGTPGVPQGVPQELVKGYQATEPEPPPVAPEPKAEAKPKPKPKVVAKPKEESPSRRKRNRSGPILRRRNSRGRLRAARGPARRSRRVAASPGPIRPRQPADRIH